MSTFYLIPSSVIVVSITLHYTLKYEYIFGMINAMGMLEMKKRDKHGRVV